MDFREHVGTRSKTVLEVWLSDSYKYIQITVPELLYKKGFGGGAVNGYKAVVSGDWVGGRILAVSPYNERLPPGS